MNSRPFKFYHREVPYIRKHNRTSVKPTHYIGNHRILDDIQSVKQINRPSRSEKEKKLETENKSGKEFNNVSFSHRAVAMRTAHAEFNVMREREKQIEINRLTNYFVPKVHKLNPSQISQSIVMRSKLAKLLPKKDLQPVLYPKSSILIQKHLRLVNPCENYKKSRNLDKILDQQKKVPTARENLYQSKRRSMEGTRFSLSRTLENTPWSRSGFLERAMKLVGKEKRTSKEITSPFNNLISYAKNLANAVKRKQR